MPNEARGYEIEIPNMGSPGVFSTYQYDVAAVHANHMLRVQACFPIVPKVISG